MSRSLITLFDGAALLAVAALVLKVTLLLAGCAALAALLRYRSAAARHLVWALGIGGALALAVIAPIVPSVPVAVLDWPLLPVPVTSTTGAIKHFPTSAPSVTTNSDATRAERVYTMSSTTARNGPLSSAGAVKATSIVAGLWLAGFLGVLLWILLGHIGLARLARTAIPAESDEWRTLIREAAKQTGVERAVRFGLSPAAGGPVTWGWSHPVVLFPLDAESWPRERRRAALVHELAHVARRDYLARLGASIACAAYWFHPLVWLAARRLRTESELACDDRVLSSGTAPPDYAVHLLGVARDARELRLGGFVAVSMARPSHLEGRLLAVLDANRPRRTVSLRARLLATTAFGLMLIPFAGMRPELRAATSSTKPVTNRPPDLASVALAQPETKTVAGLPPEKMEAIPAMPSASVAAPDSAFERVVRAAPGELLFLDLETGGSVAIHGSAEPRVSVRARLAGHDWEGTRVVIERMDGGVRVLSTQNRGNGSYSTSHQFVISVPKRFNVRLRSGGGAVKIIGVEGTFRGQTGGGELTLERVSGQANLSTGGGDIAISDSDLRGSVSTGGGMVSFSRVRGGVRGSSGSGPVIYTEGPDADVKGNLKGVTVDEKGKIDDVRAPATGVLHVRRAGGDIEIRQAPDGADISTGGGRIRVGQASGMVDAHTGGGDIEIGPVAGSVRAGTGAGKVHIEVVNAQGEEQSVEVTTGTGRVEVVLPPNLDATIDLETAYTQTFGRATIIESPWDLERDETTAWDGSQGTPRRFVRASGVVGSGRGLVRIRTVNGDIVLRRGER